MTGRLVICSLQPLDFRPHGMWRCYTFFLMLAMGTSPNMRAFSARMALAAVLYSTAQAWSLGQIPGAASLVDEDGGLTVQAALTKGPLLLRAVLGVPEFSLTALASCLMYMQLPRDVLVRAPKLFSKATGVTGKGLMQQLCAGSGPAAVCAGAFIGLLACSIGFIKASPNVPQVTPAFMKQVG
jgi:hypothetical protein